MRSFIFLGLLIIAGCVTGERIVRLEPGMSKEKAISIMGRPTGYQHSGDYESLQYANRVMSGWSWNRADYNVILKEGKVIEFGAGTVRESQPNTLVLVPVR